MFGTILSAKSNVGNQTENLLPFWNLYSIKEKMMNKWTNTCVTKHPRMIRDMKKSKAREEGTWVEKGMEGWGPCEALDWESSG